MEATTNKPNIVKLMRKIRDQFSLDIMNISFEEQKTYVKKCLKEQKKKRKKPITKYKHNDGLYPARFLKPCKYIYDLRLNNLSITQQQ